jgi:hypothetical protein
MRVRPSPRPPTYMRAWRNWQTRLAQDQCQLAGSTPAVRTTLRLPMVRLTVSKAVTGGSNPSRSAMHCKPMASAPAATRWNAVRFRGSAPTEGAKRRQRLLVSKPRAPQGWRFDSSALRQLSAANASKHSQTCSGAPYHRSFDTIPNPSFESARTRARRWAKNWGLDRL